MADTIYIYAEVSCLSGRRCYKDDAETRDDVNSHEATVAEYKRLRRLSRRAEAGCDLYLRRCAREVMAALR